MDRLSGLVASIVVAMAVAVTVVLVGDGTPAARIEEDLEWTLRLREAEAALATGRPQVTIIQLRAAYRAALRTGRWDAMVEVGDVARRAAEGALAPARAVPTASRAYLAALTLARDQRSLDGVLRVGQGFAALGDREMVEYCIGLAGGFADRTGGGGIVQVQAFADRYREARIPGPEGVRE